MKKYRPSGVKYKTVSLKFEKETIEKLQKAVELHDHKNLSTFIEESIENDDVYDASVERRKYGSNPIKKTFTFTEEFYNKIKQSGNMSNFVESSILKHI